MTPAKGVSTKGIAEAAPVATKKSPSKKGPSQKVGVNSPRRRPLQQPLTIRMNLTEGQMNKVTEAITQRVDGSPTRTRRVRLSEGSSPTKEAVFSEHYTLPRMTYQAHASSKLHQHEKPTFPRSANWAEETQSKPASLAERRNGTSLPRIQTSTPGQPMSPPKHSLEQEALRVQARKLQHDAQNHALRDQSYEHDSGVTSSDHQPSPEHRMNEAILDMYQTWTDAPTPKSYSQFPQRQQSLLQSTRQSKGTVNFRAALSILEKAPDTQEAAPTPVATPSAAAQEMKTDALTSPQFSPLPLYFRGQSFPSVKRGEKTMIGQNGWLDCTSAPSDCRKPNIKRMGFLESLKRIAKDVTAEINASYRRPALSTSELSRQQLAISLDAREQSLLYCELEYHLTSSLNDYISSEFDRGHLVADNLKKVSDNWLQQGRPRVLSCRYDLETQIQLVALHLNEFNFYGRRRSNPAEILGLLHTMKTNARAMAVRTFCQPDSVIAKHLVDSKALFDMLNVSHSRQRALSEIVGFFEVIIERERVLLETSGQRSARIECGQPREGC